MLQWLLVNLPGMIFNSMLECAVVTLVVYLLCAVFVFHRGRRGASLWHLVTLFFAVLFLQGLASLFIQVLYPSPVTLDALTISRILVSPAVISALALLVLRTRLKQVRE